MLLKLIWKAAFVTPLPASHSLPWEHFPPFSLYLGDDLQNIPLLIDRDAAGSRVTAEQPRPPPSMLRHSLACSLLVRHHAQTMHTLDLISSS